MKPIILLTIFQSHKMIANTNDSKNTKSNIHRGYSQNCFLLYLHVAELHSSKKSFKLFKKTDI